MKKIILFVLLCFLIMFVYSKFFGMPDTRSYRLGFVLGMITAGFIRRDR